MFQVLYSFYTDFQNQKCEDDAFFDVVFEVDGKKLYAHRGILAAASPVFKDLFIKNRSNGNEPIQINGYFYDEFYEFFDAIYCTGKDIYVNDDYIYAVIELSHIYKIDLIKEECAKCLVNNLSDYTKEQCFKAMEAVYKHKFLKFNKEIKEYIRENFDDLVEFDGFVNLDKSAIQAFVCYSKNIDKSEELCDAVYKWGKHQAMITVEMPEEEKNQLILHYINDILPFFPLNSLLEFFVNEKGLISVNEAKKVKTIQVSVTCKDKSIIGTFVDVYGIFEVIKSQENEQLYGYGEKKRCFWNQKFRSPRIPSVIQKREDIEWYLLFEKDRKLYIKHQSKIEENDYLIAEMKASGNVKFLIHKYVYVTVSRKYESMF